MIDVLMVVGVLYKGAYMCMFLWTEECFGHT